MKQASLFHARADLRSAMRQFFARGEYLEVETPVLVRCPGTEPYLRYFHSEWIDGAGKTHALYLRSSPELHMKRAVAAGCERIFQLGPCFRNGGELATWHHPEFTMLEWYRVGAEYEEFIEETAALLAASRDALAEKGYRDLWQPPDRWERLTVEEAFKNAAGIRLIDQDPELGARGVAAGVTSCRTQDDFDTSFGKVMIDRVEPWLHQLSGGKGAVLCDFPASQAALAVVEGGVAKRFEYYAAGVELCNAFSELVDPAVNQKRIAAANQKRQQEGLQPVPVDTSFLDALTSGLPRCCGNALGFDRWLAVLTQAHLDDVIPFRRDPIWHSRYPYDWHWQLAI